MPWAALACPSLPSARHFLRYSLALQPLAARKARAKAAAEPKPQGDVGDRALGMTGQQDGGALEAHPQDEGVQRLASERRVQAVEVERREAGGLGDALEAQAFAEMAFDVILSVMDAALVFAARVMVWHSDVIDWAECPV